MTNKNKLLKLFFTILLLLSVNQISAQKTYLTDNKFTKIYKYGTCKVEVYKFKKYYEVYFYNDSNYLIKKAKYEKTFEIESMPFENEFLIDTVFSYHRNGKVKTLTPYKNGNKNGKEVAFYEDSSKKTERNYKNGIQEGEEISYFRNGGELCKGNVNNTKNGRFLIAFLNGYYRIGEYQSNHLKRIEIIRYDKVLSSEYLYKDTLNTQIIDSVIIHNDLNSQHKIIKFRFKPGYRNLIKKPSENTFNKKETNDSLRDLFYKYSDESFENILENHLNYPMYCRDMGITGTVHVFFIVSKEGHFLDIFTENNSVHQQLKDEALSVIQLLDGDFIQKNMYPGIGVVPITFEIEE